MAIKNVRDRGAGVNPAADTAIINAAIQEAVAEGGGTVYFPAGVYHITSTLVVNGHSDIMVPTINSFTLSQKIPNAQLIIYPDSGHGSLFQFPELFVTHATIFLDGPFAGTGP